MRNAAAGGGFRVVAAACNVAVKVRKRGMNYAVDNARIAHSTVDGEVIAVDFVNGRYFSMRSSAADIWLMLVAALPLGETIACFQQNASEAARIDGEIRRFVAELVAADLLTPNATASEVCAVTRDALLQPRPYTTPILEKFEDMSALIMLDPVHDVTELGWPHVANPGQAPSTQE
jgi:hypothetical protein